MSVWPSIAQIAADVNSGKTKAQENIEKSLRLIQDTQDYKSIIAPVTERAKARAQEIDEKVKNGERVGQLAGVPFIAKDNFLSFGADTTAASNILRGFDAPYQATAIERLEAEGAICVAKANLDAFAHGSSTENSDFFTTHNPHDPTRVPGGSSGGSAAAVALDIAPFALGTDTGGSIRLPAAYCGVVGYKPTYGLVSRSGVVAMASSTDVVGPITRTVVDSAIVLDVMAGKDKMDSTTIERNPEGYSLTTIKSIIANTKVGVIKEYMSEGLDKNVKEKVKKTINKLKDAGCEIDEVSLPSLPLSLAVYYIVVPAEISSNLSRYDGQRYGFSDQDAGDLDQSYTMSRSVGFNDENKRRIMIGTYVLSSGYYDAYYKKAQLVRTKLINEFNDAYKKYDFLIGPTAPSVAFRIGENIDNPLHMYLSDVMTVAVNLVGTPAVSIPAGKVGKLPVGVQLIAKSNHDRELLEFAKLTEDVLS